MTGIKLFNFTSSMSLNDPHLLARMFRLRQTVFNDERDYQARSWNGMEFDRYDHLATSYFARTNQSGAVLCTSRVNPTKFAGYEHSMVGDLWPHAVDRPIPSGDRIYEGSRLAVAPTLMHDRQLRKIVLDEMVLALAEYGLRVHSKGMMAAMHPKVFSSVFASRGWLYEPLGPVTDIGAEGREDLIQVGWLPATPTVYHSVSRHTGLTNSILDVAPAMSLPQLPDLRQATAAL